MVPLAGPPLGARGVLGTRVLRLRKIHSFAICLHMLAHVYLFQTELQHEPVVYDL